MALDLVGLFTGNSSARKAADAVKDGNNKAIGTINDYYEQGAAGYQPYLDYGQGMGGLGGLNQLASGDYSGFENSPDYKYAREQMIYGQDHSASARGRLQSGGYAMDLAQGLNGLASQNLGNYRGSLQWGAGLGQNSAQGLAALGASAGNSIAGLQKDTGLAMAGKQSAYGNNAGNFLSSMSNKAGQFFGFGG